MASDGEPENAIQHVDVLEKCSVRYVAIDGFPNALYDGRFRRLGDRLMNAVSELHHIGIKVEVKYP